MLNRRHFTQQLIASIALAGVPVSALTAASSSGLLASATEDSEGNHWLQVLGDSGQHLHSIGLPARAHQVIFHPQRPWVAVVARRPGYYLWLVDYQTGKIVQKIEPQANFHFYGHAAFSADGSTLFTTENHITNGEGKVVVRDIDTVANNEVQIRNVFDSYGIGPHQLALMADKKTLVIANGGIKTHPDHPRKKLNIDTMQPSLVYLDAQSGKLQEQVFPSSEYHQLSLRHFDVNAEGKLIIGFQYQGEPFNQVPLIATHKQGQSLQFLWAPEPVNLAMKHYVGSACFDKSGQFAMLSSPRGNLVTLWDMQNNQFIDKVNCYDGCGLASSKAGVFLISNGAGDIFEYDLLSQQKTPLNIKGLPKQSWDNHMSASHIIDNLG